MKKGLLALAVLFFLNSCGVPAPDSCDCKNNIELVVNYQENAATTYEGQFNKELHKACVDYFKEVKDLDGEVLIRAVQRYYLEACVE